MPAGHYVDPRARHVDCMLHLAVQVLSDLLARQRELLRACFVDAGGYRVLDPPGCGRPLLRQVIPNHLHHGSQLVVVDPVAGVFDHNCSPVGYRGDAA